MGDDLQGRARAYQAYNVYDNGAPAEDSMRERTR
jgi:hypothetical protein